MGEKDDMSDKENRLDAPELTAEKIKPKIFLADSEAADKYRALLSQVLIDPNNREPEPEALLTLNDTPILWRGGKSFVCAVAKARKTTTLTMFSAILCGRDESRHGFRSKPGSKVLYVDTEQARTDSQRILFRTAKLCNKEAAELPMQVLSLNKLSPADIRGVIETAVEQYHPDVLVLDNWTDCVASVMDDIECTEFSRKLRELAEVYNIAVFSVIHANESAKNDDKPNFRGWGAEEARKSDLTLFLKDMGDYSKATFGRCRGKRPDGFSVSIDANGLPCFYAEPEAPKPTNPDKYADILAKIPSQGISYKELCSTITTLKKLSGDSAKRWVRDMKNAGVVSESNGRYYKQSEAPKTEEILPF